MIEIKKIDLSVTTVDNDDVATAEIVLDGVRPHIFIEVAQDGGTRDTFHVEARAWGSNTWHKIAVNADFGTPTEVVPYSPATSPATLSGAAGTAFMLNVGAAQAIRFLVGNGIGEDGDTVTIKGVAAPR